MTTPRPSNLYSQSFGTTPGNVPVLSTRDPTTQDINGPNGQYPGGQMWVNTETGRVSILIKLTCVAGVVTAIWEDVVNGPSGIGTINNISPDLTGNFTVAAGSGITITPGTNQISVGLSGGSAAVDSFTLQAGTTPCVPNGSGAITFNGGTVVAGSTPVQTNGTAANTMAVQVQTTQSIPTTDPTKIGLSAFNSGHFYVDGNGFVSLAGGGQAVDSFIPDAGTNPVVPASTGAITLSGGTTGLQTLGGTNSVSLQGTLIPANGGTGQNSFTPWSVICAGTTGAGNFQNVSGVGTLGQVLTSNGPSALPTWQIGGNTVWPVFLAYLSASVPNATGNGNAYVIIFDTAVINQTSSYSTSTGNFVAPIAGNYRFSVSCTIDDLTNGNTDMVFYLSNVSSGVVYRIANLNPGAVRNNSDQAMFNGTIIIPMALNDNVQATMQVSNGGADTVTIVGGATGYQTSFCGELLC